MDDHKSLQTEDLCVLVWCRGRSGMEFACHFGSGTANLAVRTEGKHGTGGDRHLPAHLRQKRRRTLQSDAFLGRSTARRAFSFLVLQGQREWRTRNDGRGADIGFDHDNRTGVLRWPDRQLLATGILSLISFAVRGCVTAGATRITPWPPGGSGSQHRGGRDVLPTRDGTRVVLPAGTYVGRYHGSVYCGHALDRYLTNSSRKAGPGGQSPLE